jgi:hypothetical protein
MNRTLAAPRHTGCVSHERSRISPSVSDYLHTTLLASVATISRLGVTDALLGATRLGCASGRVLDLHRV